jgi:3-dehydroquinate synthase
MSHDKKVANGALSLVLLRGPLGGCVVTNDFEWSKLEEVVEKYVSMP